ncbi:MAG: hypothetical protein HY529_04850 [Chloroflexi bacterium]|nr:hypothetical protein [Chloroflexota bacterium]
MDSEEKAKLRTLLTYWVKHNKEHSQEFEEWAGKLKAFGEAEAGGELLLAAKEMEKASQNLSRALRRLEKKER